MVIRDQTFAACDTHLPSHLRACVPEGAGRGARVVHIGMPDPAYMCDCGIPAHWYLKIYQPEPL